MAIPSDIMEEFGINTDPVVQATPQEPVSNISSNHPDDDFDSRVSQLYGNRAESNQPAQQPAQPATPEGTKPEAPTQAEGQQQAAPAANSDPWAAFNDKSGKAFFNEAGEMDSQKINDYFLTNGKSFLKYATPEAVAAEPVTTVAPKVDPEAFYNDQMKYVFDNFAEIVADQQAKGYTHEQALDNIYSSIERTKADYQQKLELRAAIEEQTKQMAPEIQQAREDRINAKIYSNVTELASVVDGLVDGMEAVKILDQFILNPKYGGSELDMMLLRDKPEISKMAPAEKDVAVKKWFREFQSDKAAMAHVAEFGRLRWQVEQFIPMIEHAQQIGAQKATMSRETATGGLSTLMHAPAASGNSKLERFFGADSVN